MKPATILFFTIFFFSSHALAWTIKADFEDGTVGARAESPTDAFHMAAGRSYYANTPALSGNQSASVSVKKGETGYGVWGGGFTFPQKLKKVTKSGTGLMCITRQAGAFPVKAAARE